MKNHLEKLNQLIADNLIDINDFYCITLDSGILNLQGHFSAASFKKYDALVNLKFDNETAWFKGRKDGVAMILTTG